MDLRSTPFDRLLRLKNILTVQLEQVEAEINSRNDGYWYFGLMARLGYHSRHSYNNIEVAKQAVEDGGLGDNYLIRIYTNNPAAPEGWYIVQSVTEIPEHY